VKVGQLNSKNKSAQAKTGLNVSSTCGQNVYNHHRRKIQCDYRLLSTEQQTALAVAFDKQEI